MFFWGTRHGENVIEFHIHVKLHIFRCTSWENVIKFHAHVKWHVFKTASREIVIKFHVGAYQVKMSLNSLYTPNDVVRCVPWENIIKYNIHAKRQVFRGFSLENVIECHMHVSWHVLGVCHGKMSLNFIKVSNDMLSGPCHGKMSLNSIYTSNDIVTWKYHKIPCTRQMACFRGASHENVIKFHVHFKWRF